MSIVTISRIRQGNNNRLPDNKYSRVANLLVISNTQKTGFGTSAHYRYLLPFTGQPVAIARDNLGCSEHETRAKQFAITLLMGWKNETMSRQRLPQHYQSDSDGSTSSSSQDTGVASSSVPAMEIDVPTTEAQHKLPTREQQLLKLKEQEEQLRFLEEQLRLASIEAPSRSLPTSRSGTKRGKTSIRRRSPGVAFCEDVLCYTNPRDYDEIVSSWYSVSRNGQLGMMNHSSPSSDSLSCCGVYHFSER